MTNLEIIGFPPSTYTQSARLACAEKGVDHALTPAAGFREPSYLAVHPLGKFPALRHGKVHLFESSAIGIYVDRTFDGPRLSPEDGEAYATMIQWMSAAVDYVYPAFVRAELADTPPDDDVRETRRRAGTALEQALAGSGFVVGDTLTLADIELAPMLNFFRGCDDGPAFLEEHPAVAAWLDRVRSRPAFAQVVPS